MRAMLSSALPVLAKPVCSSINFPSLVGTTKGFVCNIKGIGKGNGYWAITKIKKQSVKLAYLFWALILPDNFDAGAFACKALTVLPQPYLFFVKAQTALQSINIKT